MVSKKGGKSKRAVQDTLLLDELFRGASTARSQASAKIKPPVPVASTNQPKKHGALPNNKAKVDNKATSPPSSESDDDALYLELFGAPAPPKPPKPAVAQAEQRAAPEPEDVEASQSQGPRPAASTTAAAMSSAGAVAPTPGRAAPSTTTTTASAAPGQQGQPAAAAAKSEDEEDDFEVTFDDLEVPTPAPKPAGGAGGAPAAPGHTTPAPTPAPQKPAPTSAAATPATTGRPFHPNSRTYVLGGGGSGAGAGTLGAPTAIPGLGAAAAAPQMPSGPGARPAVPPGLQANRRREEQQAAAGKAAGTATPGGGPMAAPGITPPVVPWARPQYVNVATGMMTTISPDAEAAFPTQAAPGQWLKLPKQTRVTPEEYREFLSLGHGEIFTLDLDRVIDAPWRAPNANPSDYFNYGMNERGWREYCRKVEQYRAEYSLRNKIVPLNSDNSMLYGGNASLAALSDLPSEVAEVMAKDWPSSTAEAEEASNDAASGQFLDAPPTWPALPSNRARTYEWRRTRARLDPEAVIELVKPEEPKESEVPFGAAFPNIEYEEPARMQDRDRQRFISLEDSQNPTSFKRDPEAPLQPRIPPPRPPSQPPPMASLVSPGLPVTADAAAAAAAAGFPAGMLLPEAMMLGGGLVAESHLRPPQMPLPQLQQQAQQPQQQLPPPQQPQPQQPQVPHPAPSPAAAAAAAAALAASRASQLGGSTMTVDQRQQAALQQHELAVRQMQQRRQQEQQQYQQEPHMQPQQQQQQQQQQPPQAQLQAGAQVQQPSIEATTAVAGGGATAAPEDGALDERWHAAQYLPIDEDVFVGGKVGGLTAGEEEEEEEEELAAASYYDNYMGSAAEGAFYGEEEQEGLYDQQHAAHAGAGQGVLDLLGLHTQAPVAHEFEEGEEEGHQGHMQQQQQQQQQQQWQQEQQRMHPQPHQVAGRSNGPRAHSPIPKRPRSPRRRSRSPSKRSRQDTGSRRGDSSRASGKDRDRGRDGRTSSRR